jgi:hypothetical protein
MREIAVTYQCTSGNLSTFNDEQCPHSIKEAPPMYYISAIMGVIYGIGIPLLFIIIIQKDCSFVFRNYGCADDYEDLKSKKKRLNNIKKEYGKKSQIYKELQDYIKRRTKDLTKKYQNSIREHNSPGSILYVSYKYYFRFYKVFQLLERIILCLLASLLPQYTNIQAPVGFSVICIYGLTSIIARPYLDVLTNVIDFSTHITIFLNLLVGYILVRKESISSKWLKFNNVTASSILYSVNGLNIVILLLIMVAYLFKVKFLYSRSYKKRMKQATELKDIMREEINEMNPKLYLEDPIEELEVTISSQ